MITAATILAYRKAKGLTQKELASKAGVSQSTVSRAERSSPVRNGQAHGQLVSYMQHMGAPTGEAEPALTAVRETWDGTEAHAEALATLIRASLKLWRGEGAR